MVRRETLLPQAEPFLDASQRMGLIDLGTNPDEIAGQRRVAAPKGRHGVKALGLSAMAQIHVCAKTDPASVRTSSSAATTTTSAALRVPRGGARECRPGGRDGLADSGLNCSSPDPAVTDP
jgi:hypothetical protein